MAPTMAAAEGGVSVPVVVEIAQAPDAKYVIRIGIGFGFFLTKLPASLAFFVTKRACDVFWGLCVGGCESQRVRLAAPTRAGQRKTA